MRSGLVLCHGCFDILHIGHFRHFAEARRHGARLVVSVTAARFVNKGPGHPAHSDAERLEQLRALRLVDDVYLCEEPTGAGAIYRFAPEVYAKGRDYASVGIRSEEVEACARVGARVVYTASEKRSVVELTRPFWHFVAA